MLLWIALALLVLWGIGLLVFHLGAVIHLAVIAAVVFFVWHWLAHRNAAR